VTENKIKIAPSMLSADFSRMGEEVCKVVEAGADLIHLDVMDAHFTPNLTMGPQLVKSIRRYTDLPFDVHLMITHPQDYIDVFAEAGAGFITFHLEINFPIQKVIDQIKKNGIQAGIALRPVTPISSVEPYLADLDLILPMSVDPGFSGQSFMMNTLEKLDQLQKLIRAQDKKIEIEVDGGITLDTARLVGSRGATILVAGTAIFRSDNLKQAIGGLREAASPSC
jgi:ribulose-phosphate 3-epimerase